MELTATPPKGNNCAFLCVYNRDQWMPVDWGKINNDKKKAHFKNINDSLLYCVMYYDWMKLKPASQPFFLGDHSAIKSFTTDSGKLFNFKYVVKQKKANQSYKLFAWMGEWQEIATELLKYEGVNNILEFRNVPTQCLYKINDGLRPFWFSDGKLVRSEQGNPFRVKKLN